MQVEDDPNVIYGGDTEDLGPLNENCASLGELILKNLQQGGNRKAFVNGSTNQSWTFNNIRDQTILMAKTMHGAGIRQNDVITIISENRHEYSPIAFGAICLNAIIAPINATYSERELVHALQLSKPKVLFVTPTLAGKVTAVCRRLGFVKRVILITSNLRNLNNFVATLGRLVKTYEKMEFNIEDHVTGEVDLHNQVAAIFCSSGTTGLPKGVEITHENMMACLQTYKINIKAITATHNIDTIALNIAPWYHVLGFVSMFMFACSSRSTFVFLAKFDEITFYKAIEQNKVNFLVVVPPIMVLLAKSPNFEKFDLSSVKDISSGAAALSREVEDQVRERFGGKIVIRQGYGMSEVTYGVTGSLLSLKPGSVGQPYRGVYAKVIDENGRSLGPNQKGEACFKGKRIMKGYINDPKATSEMIDKDGWLHSGDIAYYDEDKHFFIVDRLKELIKYKAFQVPPAEIEGLLLSHPKVKDCGVIGIPDEEAGELPFAYVVKQPGANLTEQEVIEFVAKNSSKAKWLRGGVKFIEAIPKNPSGKILRRELRELFKNSKSKL